MRMSTQDIWINRVGMAAIVLVSMGYVLFGSTFAQMRLEFSFLNFPVFIGEILFCFSLLLLIFKIVLGKQELGRWGWILGAYFLFILVKAFGGYFHWGPLAFRDAALFYYPFFIVFGYSFWSYDLGGDKIRRLFVAMILTIFILHQFSPFWSCSLIIIGVILALQAKDLQERMIILAAILIAAPYEMVFDVSIRTIFLSSLITVIFIGVIIFIIFCRDQRIRIVGVLLGALVLGTALFRLSQTDMGKTFVIKDALPLAAPLSQEPSPGKCLFHPVGSSPDKPDAIKEFYWRMMKRQSVVDNKPIVKEGNSNTAVSSKKSNNVPGPKEIEGTLGMKKADTLFRYYIWRDMLSEYVYRKPVFGFAFGRPLFSSTLLKYFKEASTQHTDGWVGAHNSFFNMIYRAGIVGLALVLLIFAIWVGLLRDFYILRDWAGILLCAILLNWFVSANFCLIFELPYTAIPLWTILGVAIKHRTLLKK